MTAPVTNWRARELLTVAHAAALLSCSPATLRRKAKARLLHTSFGVRVPVAWVMEQLGERPVERTVDEPTPRVPLPRGARKIVEEILRSARNA